MFSHFISTEYFFRLEQPIPPQKSKNEQKRFSNKHSRENKSEYLIDGFFCVREKLSVICGRYSSVSDCGKFYDFKLLSVSMGIRHAQISWNLDWDFNEMHSFYQELQHTGAISRCISKWLFTFGFKGGRTIYLQLVDHNRQSFPF